MAIPGAVQNILSPTLLINAGWDINLSAGPGGSHINVPGHPKPFPIVTDPRGNPWVTLVLTSPLHADPTFELLDPSQPSHARARQFPFLLDTGAEHCVLPSHLSPS